MSDGEVARADPDPGQQGTGLQQSLIYQEQYSGPLPPPATLAQYEQIVPGSGAKIISAFVDQGAHRQYLERTVVDGNVEQAKRGQTYGLIVAVLFFILGGYALYLGQPWAASVIAGLDLVGLVSVFVWGRTESRKDLGAKREAMDEVAEHLSAGDQDDPKHQLPH